MMRIQVLSFILQTWHCPQQNADKETWSQCLSHMTCYKSANKTESTTLDIVASCLN
uniref:Uncharacterized protein n=1 Tax=Arundo donax TaxID=35708 RepID=A0A0A9BTX4_ARUDO